MVGSTVKAQNLIPSHKNSFNYLDFGDDDSSDVDSTTSFADAGLDNISVGSKTKIVLWDPNKNVHTVINVPKAAAGTATTATTGAAATVSTITTTGWVNYNGAWYYLGASGSMLSDTTVDGYVLGSDGAWIQ